MSATRSTSENITESKTDIFEIQRRLFGDSYPLYLDISQIDFEAMLMKIYPSVSSLVCTTLFREIDKVGSGWIDAENIVQYLRGGEEQGSRFHFVVRRMLRASVEGCLFFFSGASISISNNILHRHMKHNMLLKILDCPLRIWCFAIGSLCFAWEACSHENQYNSMVLMMNLWENLTSLDQLANSFWFIGSVAYAIAIQEMASNIPDEVRLKLCLAGGTCYFIGGLFANMSVYRGILTQIMQKQEIIYKVVAVVSSTKGRVGSDEEKLYYPMASDITNDTPKKLVSYPGIQSFVGGIDFPKHKLSPSCPAIVQGRITGYILKDAEELSSQTVDTDQLTEFSEEGNDEVILFIGQDIEVREPVASASHKMMDCSEIYRAIQPASLDAFLMVWRDINFKYPKGVYQYASTRFKCDLISDSAIHRHLVVCKRLAISVNFLCSIMSTVAGFIFMIGACELGVSDPTLSNLFLSGSCLYICGSIYSLYQAWRSANIDWNQIKFCRLALCHKAGCKIRT